MGKRGHRLRKVGVQMRKLGMQVGGRLGWRLGWLGIEVAGWACRSAWPGVAHCTHGCRAAALGPCGP